MLKCSGKWLPSFPQAPKILRENPLKVPLQSGQSLEQMPKINIAVGSKRGPKINAVKQALEVFSPYFPPGTEFELAGLEVDSGVSHTPSSQEELMRGARQRAETLAREVIENDTELAVAIDRFAGMVGIRDAQGAWGVLSGHLISRQEAFRVAVIAAFAPFYNAKMYRAAAVGASGWAS